MIWNGTKFRNGAKDNVEHFVCKYNKSKIGGDSIIINKMV